MTNAHDIGTGFMLGLIVGGFIYYSLPVISRKVHLLDFIGSILAAVSIWIQAVEKGTASPELRKFVAANTSFINAYARAINPQGVGTVADKEHAREMLDVAFSKGDYTAVISQLKAEIAAAKASPGTVKTEMRERFTGVKGGSSGEPAGQTNAKGWKLHTDASGNKAYVSPDGKQFEEVK